MVIYLFLLKKRVNYTKELHSRIMNVKPIAIKAIKGSARFIFFPEF